MVRSWGMVGRSWGMVGRGMNNGGMSNHSRPVNNWGMVWGGGRVVGSSVVDKRSSMEDRGSMCDGGRMRDNHRSGGVVSSNISWSVCRGNGSRMAGSSRVLLRIMVSVNSLGSSMRLTHHSSGVGTMSLVN